MHFSIDRTVHTTAFDKPVVDHWLERKIAQTAAGSTEKDRSDNRPLQRWACYRLSYIPLPMQCSLVINKGNVIYIYIAVYCTVLYCTVLYCTVLYCIVLYCIIFTYARFSINYLSRALRIHLYYGFNIESYIEFLATNMFLIMIQYADTNMCTFCNNYPETL